MIGLSVNGRVIECKACVSFTSTPRDNPKVFKNACSENVIGKLGCLTLGQERRCEGPVSQFVKGLLVHEKQLGLQQVLTQRGMVRRLLKEM